MLESSQPSSLLLRLWSFKFPNIFKRISRAGRLAASQASAASINRNASTSAGLQHAGDFFNGFVEFGKMMRSALWASHDLRSSLGSNEFNGGSGGRR
jgi:hypothetical protein